MFDWSRTARKRRYIEKAGSDPTQTTLTEYYHVLTDIEKLLKANQKLSALLQANMQNEEKGEPTLTVNHQSFFSTILKQIILNAEKNAGKHCTSRRHPIILWKFSIGLFIYAGPLAYEFIYKNMPEALPSIRTIQSAIHSEYKTINEGQFRFDDLVQHLHNYNIISISEDATRVIARVDYDNETNRCVGFVLPIDTNGLPINDSFLATSFTTIEKMFSDSSIAKFAYIYMAQPLQQNISPFCLSYPGSDNKFTAQEVLLKWKYIVSECSKRNVMVLSFSRDGDTRVLNQ